MTEMCETHCGACPPCRRTVRGNIHALLWLAVFYAMFGAILYFAAGGR
jgi:hypothetical protein